VALRFPPQSMTFRAISTRPAGPFTPWAGSFPAPGPGTETVPALAAEDGRATWKADFGPPSLPGPAPRIAGLLKIRAMTGLVYVCKAGRGGFSAVGLRQRRAPRVI
jgi:hypothetical protein